MAALCGCRQPHAFCAGGPRPGGVRPHAHAPRSIMCSHMKKYLLCESPMDITESPASAPRKSPTCAARSESVVSSRLDALAPSRVIMDAPKLLHGTCLNSTHREVSGAADWQVPEPALAKVFHTACLER